MAGYYGFTLVGVVEWGRGVVYLTSPGRPVDIGLQLFKAYYPLQQVRVQGECFYFFCFFTFIHFTSSPVPIFDLLYYLFYLPFCGRQHKMTHKGWRVVKLWLNQSMVSPWTSVCLSVCLSVCQSYVHPSGFHFRMITSKYQWIFTKLGMCIDIVEIWFGIANRQISSNFDGVICLRHIFISGR